jgi:phage shock protein A
MEAVTMGLLRRTRDLMTAAAHEKLDRWERPEAMLRLAVFEMESQLADALHQASTVLASERLLAREIAQVDEEAGRWRRRAEGALDAGDDAQARECLGRRLDCQILRGHLEGERAAAEKSASQWRTRMEQLRFQAAQARRFSLALDRRDRRPADALLDERGAARFERVREQLLFSAAKREARQDLLDACVENSLLIDVNRQEQIDASMHELKALRAARQAERPQGD